METLKGDFIGFEYNGIHSSELGIVRTSNGSRFNENLLPTISDKTAQVSGRDGMYFFGSQFTQKPINISIASDCLTERQYRNLRKVFGDKKIHSLIFDETPYKKYLVKINGTPNFNFICFDENGERIYKGEGTLSFMAYYPYAKSVKRYLNEYTETNLNEWSTSINMLETDDFNNEKLDTFYNNYMYCYNGGDIDTDYRLFMFFSGDNLIPAANLNFYNFDSINSNDLEWYGALKINEIYPVGNDVCVCFNSETKLIEGYEAIIDTDDFSDFDNIMTRIRKSGNIYNRFIAAGELKKMPVGFVKFEFDSSIDNKLFIDYNYLYY